MNSKLLKAIVIDQVNGRTVGRGPYRNIKPAAGSIKNYMRNMKALFPGATHINFYDFKGIYLFQERYETEQFVEEKRKRLVDRYLNNYFFLAGQPRSWNEMVLSQWDP